MKWIHNISLKFKLMALLVFLTVAMLSVYGLIVLRDFENDKIAYVLDSNLAHSRSVALQVRSDISYVLGRVQFLMRGYQFEQKAFHPYTQSIFPSEDNLTAMITYHIDPATQETTLGASINKTDYDDNLKSEVTLLIPALIQDARAYGVALRRLTIDQNWLLATHSGPVVVVALVNSAQFLNLFETSQMQDTYLVDESEQILLSPRSSTYTLPANDLNSALKSTLAKLKAPEGINEVKTAAGKPILIALARVGSGDLQVMSLIPRSAALEAVRSLVIKSVLFILFLFCLTVFLSVLSSTGLTASLKRLLAATKKITQGDFSVQVEASGQDEIGSLSRGFNKMAQEIQRLLKETEEKIRMEGELKTAQLVQSTLFPTENLFAEDLQICGFYQPASECSGDWWFYKRLGNKTLFCIGDATGHGVPAALLTAAARSAASALENFPDLALNEMMSIFNRAIYNTANGKVMMTFFLGAYNHDTGEIQYTNASHEPPYLMPHKDEPIKKKDLQLLNEANGPRLGENPVSQYKIASMTLQPGDRIMLYTDGVTELKNSTDDMWGERALIKQLLNCSNERKSLEQTISLINDEIKTFRQEHPLQDDVTYFLVTRNRAA